MRTKRFYKILSIGIAGLMLLTAGLSYLLYLQGPRIRLARFNTDPSQTTLTDGSTLTLYFDRPIAVRDYERAVRVSPDIPFEVSAASQSLTLTFRRSLTHSTDYQVVVDPVITDSSGMVMNRAYEYRFRTTAPRFAYLQRSVRSADGAEDKIVIQTLGSDAPETVFQAPRIRSFSANNRYVAAVVAGDRSDRLYIIDLKTKVAREPQLYLRGRLGNLAIAPKSTTLLFTASEALDDSGTYYEPAGQLYAYDLAAETFSVLTYSDDSSVKAENVSMSKYGQVALTNDASRNYFAVSPYNDNDPVLLGSYAESFGFGPSSNEIVFRKDQEIFSYLVNEGRLARRTLDQSVYVSHVNYSYGKLFYATTSYLSGLPESGVYVQDGWDSPAELVWYQSAPDGRALGKISQSYDDALVALSLANEGCRFDSPELADGCERATTTLIDVRTKQPVDELDGANVVWLP